MFRIITGSQCNRYTVCAPSDLQFRLLPRLTIGRQIRHRSHPQLSFAPAHSDLLNNCRKFDLEKLCRIGGMKPNVIGGVPPDGLVQEYTDFIDVAIVFRSAQVHAFIQLVYSASQALRIGEPDYGIAMANARKSQP